MYNTVGETAGVTQDVGSDPTVGDPVDFYCCTLCGMDLGEEGWEEGFVQGEEEHEGKATGVNVAVCDLSEMSGMEEEDEDVDGEPDTTGDDHREMTTGHYGREKGEVEGGRGGRMSHPTNPERKTS